MTGDAPSGVAAVVLAAGAGTRFGGGKLLAELDGRPVIGHVLANLEEAPVSETVVVVGSDAERVRAACEPYGVRVVENPDWRAGQSASVRAGLAALRPEVRAVVVLLGDQPSVSGEAVERLVGELEAGAKVAVATYGGKRRNPVLFARQVWPLLLEELSGDEGARSVLRRRPDLVTEVPCDGVSDPADVDTREDLEALQHRGVSRGRRHTFKMGQR